MPKISRNGGVSNKDAAVPDVEGVPSSPGPNSKPSLAPAPTPTELPRQSKPSPSSARTTGKRSRSVRRTESDAAGSAVGQTTRSEA